MCRLFKAKEPFEAFVVIRSGSAASSLFCDLYTCGSLDCIGSLVSSRLFQFSYFDSRPSSSQAEEDHATHCVFEFVDEFDMQIRQADVVGVASSYVVAYYVDVINLRSCQTDEIKSSFQQTTFTDSVSIQIITDDVNCRLPPKKKRTHVPQADSNVPHRPETRYCIRSQRKDPHNTWISHKHKWRSHAFQIDLQSIMRSCKRQKSSRTFDANPQCMMFLRRDLGNPWTSRKQKQRSRIARRSMSLTSSFFEENITNVGQILPTLQDFQESSIGVDQKRVLVVFELLQIF